ncbi:MAG: hypothetical protein ABIR55_06925 [Burkholderiaceae bacterium]
MKLATTLFLALAVAITGTQTWAATAAEHDAHHPAGTASAPAAKTMPSKSKQAMARIDAQMKSMQEIHNKMMAAKTPEERNALMAEHTKAMQDGMAMMNGITPGDISSMPKDIAARQQIMEKHMEMMQYMMQMMVDRLPPVSAK